MQIKIKLNCLLLLLLVGFSVLSAQNGKISGRITDNSTGEPLIGANILIEGTNYGSATDIDGEYVILNVRPGKYNIKASMVGFTPALSQDVVVYIGRTTKLDFELIDETIEMGQVVIIAKTPPVVRDRTSSTTNIQAEQIEAAPIEGLRGTMGLSAGFQKNASGNFQVRGSEAYEISFKVNGVSMSNSSTSAPASFGTEKADNSWKYDINQLAVQQVELVTGGFSAEYGDAQAGVVNVVLKEGKSKFHGDFKFEYRPSGQYHYGPYIYDKNNYEWQKWGDLDDWMARRDEIITELNLDSRYSELKNSDPDRYNEIVNREIAWAHDIWVQNHEPSDDNILGVYDYRQYSYQRYLFGFGGPLGLFNDKLTFFLSGEYKSKPTRLPTPEKNQITQNYILNLSFTPVKNHKLKLTTNYQYYRGGIWSGADDIRWSGLAFTPPGVSSKYIVSVDPVREEQTFSQALTWVYTIDTKSFLELVLAHQNEKYELPYRYLAGYNLEVDRLDSLNDVSGTVLKDGLWWEDDYFRAPFGFSTNYYQDSRTEYTDLSVNYTSQINSKHLIKTGAGVGYWDMMNNAVNSSFQTNSFVARNGFADYYEAYPIDFSFYIQDKMEFEGMVANIGLRAEVYNYQTQVPVDPFNILYPGTDGPGILGNPDTKSSDWKMVILPRLGLSFPIGEATAFRIQYGHFASGSLFSQALSRKTWVGWQGFGNPNLDPKLTINYEFGLQQQLDENHRLDLVLYYNDRTSQVGTQRIASYTGSRNQNAGFTTDNQQLYYYYTYDNNRFGSTIGFEAILETITRQNWAYRLSYSLSKTNSGAFGPPILYPDNTRGYSERDHTGEFLASWDRTHNFRALLQYFSREGEGPKVFGIYPFENFVISMTYSAQSGLPFTYRTDFSLRDVFYNRRYPLESTVDLSMSKDISIGEVDLHLGLRVMNLFDNKWLTPISTTEDLQAWVNKGQTLADPGDDPTRLAYITAPYRAFSNLPRQVFFTIGAGF